MTRRVLLVISFIGYLFSQVQTDKPIETCGHLRSANKLLSSKSTLTEDQGKIDITYYRIDLEIDIVEQEISGSVIVNGLVGFDQPDSIVFDLSNDLEVDSLNLNNEPSSFIHEDNLLKIPAGVSIPEGYDFNVEIFYHGTPSSSGFGSFNFDAHAGIDHIWTLSEPYGARDWWPCKDDPSDKADSVDVIITVPEAQIVVSNGLMVQELELENDRKQYHWSERYPICTYLVSVTTYPYTVWHDQYIGLEGDTLPLDYYVYPDHYDLVYDNYLLTNDMMEVFAERFGEYPFMGEKYGHAEFGRGGGMEHQTISSMGGHSQWLIAHELGHQWWGNLVTCASFHHIWLNEGFARFSEAIWYEAYNGVEAYKDYWQTHAYYGPGTVIVEDPSTTSQIFNGSLTYNKGGWVVHMLRGVMGDSLFFEALKSYAYNDTLAYSAVTTEDLQAVFEDVSEIDLNDFFQQWIYGDYYPRYGVSWERLENEELLVKIQQLQAWQYFHMPIDLQVITQSDTLIFRLDNQGELQEYNLGFINSPTFNIRLDPDNWILKEVEYLAVDGLNPDQSQLFLYPNYPNPFNPETSILYYIPDNLGEIKPSIKIYDIKGRMIDKVIVDRAGPGLNKTKWNASGHGSGTYFIRLETDNSFYQQKVQLLK